MAEADGETPDSSVRGVCISDLIPGRIFAVASLSTATESAHIRAVTGAADIYAFLLIFDKLIFNKLIVDKRITQSERRARPSLAQAAPRQSANS
jgi:hypothetical protein